METYVRLSEITYTPTSYWERQPLRRLHRWIHAVNQVSEQDRQKRKKK